MTRPRHRYVLSTRSYDSLNTLFCKPPHRTTVSRRRPFSTYTGFTIITERPDQDTPSVKQGLSYSLTLLARNYDPRDWSITSNPATVPNQLQDDSFIQECLDDLRTGITLPGWQQKAYEEELSLVRKRHVLVLDKSTRSYYAALLSYLDIPLPTKPHLGAPDILPHRSNLTTHVSHCLECIGSSYILPPDDYQEVLAGKTNPYKRRIQSVRSGPHQARKYGNHEHTPYVQKQWRNPPDDLSKWTQADIDYCLAVGLEDLAEPAAKLNPSLVYNPVRRLSKPSLAELAATQATQDPSISSRSQRARGKRRVDIIESPPVEYTYKGRDVTPLVIEAHDKHFNEGIPLTEIDLVTENIIAYNSLRVLVHRHHAALTYKLESTDAQI